MHRPNYFPGCLEKLSGVHQNHSSALSDPRDDKFDGRNVQSSTDADLREAVANHGKAPLKELSLNAPGCRFKFVRKYHCPIFTLSTWSDDLQIQPPGANLFPVFPYFYPTFLQGNVDITDHKMVPADAQLASDYQSVSSVTPPAKKAKDMHAVSSCLTF